MFTKTTIGILIAALILVPSITTAEQIESPPSPKIQYQLLADSIGSAYQVQIPLMKRIIACESSWNAQAWNKSDPHGGSKGLFQFQTSTFNSYAEKIGIENPDIWNSEQQISVGAYMIANGQVGQWSCAHKLHLVK